MEATLRRVGADEQLMYVKCESAYLLRAIHFQVCIFFAHSLNSQTLLVHHDACLCVPT